MRALWGYSTVVVLALTAAPLPAQVILEPEIGILFREDLGRAQWYDPDVQTTTDVNYSRNAALLLGFRVHYPLTSRVSALASYGSADIAYNVAFEAPVPDRTLDPGWRLNVLSAQARVMLTNKGSPVLAALSAGGARVGMGDGPFALDGWWGGVFGATAGLRLGAATTLTATHELYFYKTDLHRQHGVREQALRLGIGYTPWR